MDSRRYLAIAAIGLALGGSAFAQDITVKSASAPFALSGVRLLQDCFDPNGDQALGIARQAFRRAGIEIVRSAGLSATVTTSPCKEFAFASRGPRDLEDAPRGPLGSKIITPINIPDNLSKSAGVRLVVRNRKNEILWDGRAKSDVKPGSTAQSVSLNLVVPLVNALILQRGAASK
jgi:hypothetical protein